MALQQLFALTVLRPYISRELPGWGKLYNKFVGDYRSDGKWRSYQYQSRWITGKLHGYEMNVDISQWSNRQTFFLRRFYDLPTQLLLQKTLKLGSTFIDIGANEGMMSLLASRLVGPSGQVIAFEPNPVPRTRLVLAISRNGIKNIQIHNVGLADQEAELELSVPTVNTGEGTFTRSPYSRNQIAIVNCEIKRGDDLLSDSNPTLIKIDVEGFEFKVLKGIEQTINRARPPVTMETIGSALERAGDNIGQINDFMSSKNYKPFRLALAPDKSLALIPEMPPADAHGDYVWMPS